MSPATHLSATKTVQWRGRPIHVSVDFSDGGQPIKVTSRGPITGSEMEKVMEGYCLLISMLLRQGSTVSEILSEVAALPVDSLPALDIVLKAVPVIRAEVEVRPAQEAGSGGAATGTKKPEASP